MKSLLLILIILSFFSCKKDYQKKIYIVSEPSWKNEKLIDSANFRIVRGENKTTYQYIDIKNDSFLSYWIEKEIGNNKVLRIFNEDSKLVDSLNLVFKNKKITIYKYLYDELNVEDDIVDYYFNNEMGLVLTKDLSWDINIYFDSENLKELHNLILKNENKFKSSSKFITVNNK